MKRPGLTSALLAATLFVATGLRAQLPKDAALAAVPAPSAAIAADLTAAEAMKSTSAEDIFQQLAPVETAVAKQEGPREVAGRAAGMKNQGGSLAPGVEGFRQRMLEMFDKNNDGRLDETERAEARKYADAHGLGENGVVREQLVKRFDKNGDGKLEGEETAALQKFLQDRQRNLQAKAAIKPANREVKLEQVAADLAKRRAESIEKAKKKEQ